MALDPVFSVLWALGALAALLVATKIHTINNAGFPRIGIHPGPFNLKLWPARIHFILEGRILVHQGYYKLKDANFRIQTLVLERLVVAPKYLTELHLLPELKLSATAALVDKTLGIHNGVDIILRDHQSSNICRVQLTKNLPTFIPAIKRELEYTFSRYLTRCQSNQYEAFNTNDFVFAMVLAVTSRVFVGSQLCRNKRWSQELSSYQKHVALTVILLLPFPEFLRPFVAFFNPSKWRLNQIHNAVRGLLFPPGVEEDTSDNVDLTLVKFFIRDSKTRDEKNIVAKLLVLLSAVLHGTTNSIINVLYDLCAMPEYIEQLRTEAQEALEQDGGVWQMETVQKLRYMDSFLKESQRYNPPSILAFTRKVMSPITLSDNVTELKPGMAISMASAAMTQDPAFYENPTEFKGDRFLSESSIESRPENQFTSTGPGNVAWGSGRFTCSGRWFASIEMKLILAKILLEYDIKFPEGQTVQPPPFYLDDGILPNRKQNILFRKRI